MANVSGPFSSPSSSTEISSYSSLLGQQVTPRLHELMRTEGKNLHATFHHVEGYSNKHDDEVHQHRQCEGIREIIDLKNSDQRPTA